MNEVSQVVKTPIPQLKMRKPHSAWVASVAGTALLLAAAAATSTSAVDQLTPVATGLNNPRGLAFGPNGSLYVAEAGLGAGNGSGGFAAGVGFTGSITEIKRLGSVHQTVTRIVTGLASSGPVESSVVGPDGVSVHGTGGIYVIMAESADGMLAGNPSTDPAALAQFGHLLKLTPSGVWKATADVGDYDYEWAAANKGQPWAPKEFPDSNPYGVLAVDGRQFIADAGANTIDEVLPDGSVRIVAYVPNPKLPAVPGGPPVITVSDAVPTCVALGPDGYLYVGTLAFGANFARLRPTVPAFWHSLPPQSKVYRVDLNGTEQFLTEADVWASGFNPITACGFGPGGFYAVEFETQASHYSAGQVVNVAVNADGSAGARSILGEGALNTPNGFAMGPDGSIYVSNFSTSSGGGEVVRVNY